MSDLDKHIVRSAPKTKAVVKPKVKSPRYVYRASGTKKNFVVQFFDAGGKVVVKRVAQDFGMSKGQLAETMGLSREALYKAGRARTPKIQGRMREMLEIVARVSDWAGGKDQAMAWYRAEPIPAFGDRTAESLVKSGQAGALRDYLDSLALGGFA
jgi:hypothetical protein